MERRELLTNITVFIISVMVMLVVFEIIVRVVYGNHLIYEVDRELYWKLGSNQKGYQVFGFPKATINSAGFRGEELSNKSLNVFMLGDSYTFGQSVRDNETFSYLLGERLFDVNKEFQVINLGTSGWGLFQDNISLYRNYDIYKPKIVVVTLLEADLNRLEFKDQASENRYLTNARLRTYFRGISFMSFLKDRIGAIFNSNFGATENYVMNATIEDLWIENVPYLNSMYNLTEKENVTLMLVLYPDLNSSNDKFYTLATKYTEGKENLILIKNLEAVFSEFEKDDLIIHGEGHPSPLAHELTADKLFLEISKLDFE